jgi:MFS family permease
VGGGELLGYGLRLISGYLSDKTHRYWMITIIGYIINLFAVPLLAIANSWQIASLLIILERVGKAIRVPARDAMLSYATKQTGRGWGFGLHEALDQIGAVSGPLLIAGMLWLHEGYRTAFAVLLIPAMLALLFLLVTRVRYPRPQEMETISGGLQSTHFSKRYWIYIVAVGFVAAGYVDFAMIAYHFSKASIVASTWIPLLYAIAMAVDGLAALIMGRLFDIKGLSMLAVVTALASLFAPFIFVNNFYAILAGVILWGIGMGSQESIMRAVIPSLVAPQKRGSAYGVLNLVFGVFWAVGSAIMGFLYDISPLYLVIFSMVAQLASVPLFLVLRKR